MVQLNLSSHTIQNRNTPFLSQLVSYPEKDNVTSINLSGRYLITSMIYQIFHIILEDFPRVQEIDLSNTSMFDMDLEIIFDTGVLFQFFTKINLSHNLLECLTFENFHNYFTMCYLQILLLDNNEIECKGIIQLALNFNRLRFLQQLSLSNNFIRDDGFLSIANNFHEFINFRNLNMSGNICQNDNFLYFLQSIPKTIQILNLTSVCNFHLRSGTIPTVEVYTSHISHILGQLLLLEHLIWNMYIDQHIVNSLYFLDKLTHLVCHRSFIHHGILIEFPYLPNLTHTHLSSISSKSMLHILENLPSSLIVARFHQIIFSEKSIQHLYTMISKQHSLRILEISESNLEDFHAHRICSLIPVKSNINSLIFSRNDIGQKKSFSKFINLLPLFSNLKVFSLYGNPISYTRIKKMVSKLLRTPFHENTSISISNGNFAASSVSLQPYILHLSKFLDVFHRQIYLTPSLFHFVNYVRNFRPIQHHIDIVSCDLQGVSHYNKLLQQINFNMKQTLGYKVFNKQLFYITLPNNSTTVLYSADIQFIIFSFLS